MLKENYLPIITSSIANALTHPLETIKVHIQLKSELLKSKKKKSIFLISRKIFEKFNLRGFYKGILTSSAKNIIFCTSKISLYNFLLKKNNFEKNKNYYFFFSIFLSTLLVNPFELILMRIQKNLYVNEKNRKNYKSFLDGFQIVKKEEGFKNLFKGSFLFILRSLILNFSFLSSYCFFQNLPIFQKKKKNQILSLISFSTFFSSLLIMPIDNLKTKFQTSDFKNSSFNKGILDCLKKTIQRESFFGLYAGYHVMFVKLFLQNTVNFYLLNEIVIRNKIRL